MAVTNINTVADFIIRYCHDHGDLVTPLKLQKLLYYSQAWHLSLNDTPLFDEEIEAWIHGPANMDIFKRFEHLSYRAIDENPELPKLPLRTKKHLIETLRAYVRYSAIELDTMTHSEDPWKSARTGLPQDAPSRNIIDKQLMRSYYKQ